MTDCLSNRHNQPASLTKPTQKAFLQKATFCLARDQVASSRLRAGPCQGFISKGHRELRGRGRVTGWAQGDWTPHCPEGPAGGCLPGSEGPQLGLPVVEHVLRALTTLLWVRPERSPTLKCEGGRKESGGRVPGHPKSGRHATGLAEGAAPSAHAPSASLGGVPSDLAPRASLGGSVTLHLELPNSPRPEVRLPDPAGLEGSQQRADTSSIQHVC